ncbi:hypothetical protein GCM10010417_48710 [Streptomyces carpaticus]
MSGSGGGGFGGGEADEPAGEVPAAAGAELCGPQRELAVFEANLRRDTNADDFRPLFHVRGQSGVGKSTLIRRWKGYAERARAATVHLDDSVHGPLEAMKDRRGDSAGTGGTPSCSSTRSAS